jgi:hypothetical protein
MIETRKGKSALLALHYVLIQARYMGYTNSSPRDIADVLDVAEYLVILLVDRDDRTAEYRQVLDGLCGSNRVFAGALERFERPDS